MTAVCGNMNCKYRNKDGFCSKSFVAFNTFGCCVHWWEKDAPNFRQVMWDYEKNEDESK